MEISIVSSFTEKQFIKPAVKQLFAKKSLKKVVKKCI